MIEQLLYEEWEEEGYTVKVHYDIYPDDPRDCDSLGTMLCSHSQYDIGDQHDLTPGEIIEYAGGNDVISLPLYLYDHSGLAMRTYPYHCVWDSGLVGYITVTKDRVRSEFKRQKITKKLKDKVFRVLKAEVKKYSDYLNGDVFGYTVFDSRGEIVDSCSGFYGCDFKSNALYEDVKRAIQHHTKFVREGKS